MTYQSEQTSKEKQEKEIEVLFLNLISLFFSGPTNLTK